MTNLYPWQASYQNAVLETDNAKMLGRVQDALNAIEQRQLDMPEMSVEERVRLEDAKICLDVLRSERATN